MSGVGPVKLAYKAFTPKVGGGRSNVIVCHGLMGNSMNWSTACGNFVADPNLGKKIHTVYSLDMRNHGGSPHSTNHSNAALASDVEAFVIDGQRRLRQDFPHEVSTPSAAGSFVIGHSMGGLALMGMLLRRYNEDALLATADEDPHASPPTRFGAWNAHRRHDTSLAMQQVNSYDSVGETMPLAPTLFNDPSQTWNGQGERVPTLGRIRAAMVVDVVPTIRLDANPRNNNVLSTLQQMGMADLSRVKSYESLKEELERVGMEDRAMRDFVATNLLLTRADNGETTASWRCNLDVLAKEYGSFSPSIVHWWENNPMVPPIPCTLPVLFVFGSRSPYNLPEQRAKIATYFPNATQVVVEGAGHFVHAEKLKGFLEVAVPFMDAHM